MLQKSKLKKHEIIIQSRTELEILGERLIAAEKPMSFERFTSDTHERFQRVADYADIFVELNNAENVMVTWYTSNPFVHSSHLCTLVYKQSVP